MADDPLYTSKYSLPFPVTGSDVKPATRDFRNLAVAVETNLSEAESRSVASVNSASAAANAAVNALSNATDAALTTLAYEASEEVGQSANQLRQEMQAHLDGIATAYDVWLAAGNDGTPEEYLDSIKGNKGDEGPYGGTEVVDPQVAALVASNSTATASAGDVRWAPRAVAAAPDERTMLNRVRVRAVLDYRDDNDVYPQAFAYNPDEGHWYLGAQPGSDGGEVFYRLYRIDASTGERVDYREWPMPQSAYCQGFHYWRAANGHLMFAAFNTAADGDNHSAYSIYDYDDDVMGDPIPINGKTQMNRVGEYVITTDSPATALRNIYVYTRASIQAGAPILTATIPLRKSGYVEKLQGLAAVGSTLFLTQGAVDTVPSVSAFDWSGTEVVTHQYSKRDLGELINAHTPGTIPDTSADYRYEHEGAWADNGHLLTGAAVMTGAAGRFVILEHNVADGAALAVTPLPQPSQWTHSGTYNGVRLEMVREGQWVTMRLEGTLTAPLPPGSGSTMNVATGVPATFRPKSNARSFAAVSTGNHQVLVLVTTGGTVQIYNYTGVQVGVMNGTQISYRVDL